MKHHLRHILNNPVQNSIKNIQLSSIGNSFFSLSLSLVCVWFKLNMAGGDWLFGSNSLFCSGFNMVFTDRMWPGFPNSTPLWAALLWTGRAQRQLSKEQKQKENPVASNKDGPGCNVTFYVLEKSLVQLIPVQKKLLCPGSPINLTYLYYAKTTNKQTKKNKQKKGLQIAELSQLKTFTYCLNSCGSAEEMANLYGNISRGTARWPFSFRINELFWSFRGGARLKDSEKDKKASGNKRSLVLMQERSGWTWRKALPLQATSAGTPFKTLR